MRRCENLLGSAYLKLTQAASHCFKKFTVKRTPQNSINEFIIRSWVGWQL